MKVVWTENAEFDLDDLYDFVAKDSPIYAEQFVDQILREIGHLEQTPRLGRKVPEANNDQIGGYISNVTTYNNPPLIITSTPGIHGF